MKRQNVRTLSLIVVTFTYLLLGAAIFDAFESEFEGKEEARLREHAECLRNKYNITLDDFERITQLGIQMKPYKAGTQWKFAGAFYFATTVITTIGYGHSTPKTTGGKIFCMCYALPGIPLCLVMFQSIGERMNTIITYLLRKTNHLLKLRNSVSQTKLMVVSFTIGSTVLTIGAAMFSRYEDWGYLDSFYYCFITLTTIGFGDFVALQRNDSLVRRPDYVAFSLIFILFGLTVVSSVMNLLVLRFLTMNTEDERRDQIEAAVYAHELQRLRGDVIWSSAEKLLPSKRLSPSNPDLPLSVSPNALGSTYSNSMSLAPPTCSLGCCHLCVKQLWSSNSEPNTYEVGNFMCNQETRKISSTMQNDSHTENKLKNLSCTNHVNNPSLLIDCDGRSHNPTLYSQSHIAMNASTPKLGLRKLSMQTSSGANYYTTLNPTAIVSQKEMLASNLAGHRSFCERNHDGLINVHSATEEKECPCVSLIMKRPETIMPWLGLVEENIQPECRSMIEDTNLSQIHGICGENGNLISQTSELDQHQALKFSDSRTHELPNIDITSVRQMMVEDQNSAFESASLHNVHHRRQHIPYQYNFFPCNPHCINHGAGLCDPERQYDMMHDSHMLASHCINPSINYAIEQPNAFWDFPGSKLINSGQTDTPIIFEESSMVHPHDCIYLDTPKLIDSFAQDRRRASL